MNNRKMDFIICFSNEESVRKCVQCIESLDVPENFEIDIISISEVDDITEAYNEIIRETDSKYRTYLQENVYITNKNYIFECLKAFEDSEIGMLGIVGKNDAPDIEHGKWTLGAIDIFNENRTQRIKLNSDGGTATGICNLLMVTQYDLEWDSSPSYDIVHSIKLQNEGYKLKVFKQVEPWAIYEFGKSVYDRLDVFTNDFGAGYCILNNKPLVSVIIPVYNGATFVRQTIESVINQNYQNIEIIIIDDCSTDDSRYIISQYAEQDKRIRTIYNEKNCNVCISSNKGFDISEGKYVALIGHDDVWVETKIEEQVKLMELEPEISVCFSTCDIIDDKGMIVSEDGLGKKYFLLFNQKNRSREDWSELLFYGGNCLCAPSALIRRDSLNQNLYFPSYVQLQDYALWLEMLKKGNIYILQENLVLYRHFFEGFDNLSTMNVDKETRLCHEMASIKYEYISGLNISEFEALFRKHRITEKELDDVLLKCEKAFILKDIENPMSFQYFAKLINESGVVDLLEDEYNYSISDFYKDNTKPLLVDNASIHTINELGDIIKQYEAIVAKLSNNQ